MRNANLFCSLLLIKELKTIENAVICYLYVTIFIQLWIEVCFVVKQVKKHTAL